MARKQDKREEKSRTKRRQERDESSDSDSVLNDSASIASGVSFNSSVRVEVEENSYDGYEDDQEDDGLANDNDEYLNKLDQVLDNLQTVKSVKSRLQQYESLAKALTNRFCCEYLFDHKITVQSILEHGLKRSDEEAGLAAHVFSLVLISMGELEYNDEIFRQLFSQLNRIMMDPTAKPSVRAKCAIALGLGCFTTNCIEKTGQVLAQLLSVAFTPVKNQSDANLMSAVFNMKATCLDMFSFLASDESSTFITKSLEENLTSLINALDSPNLSMRIAAGECIALLVEKSRMVDEDYELEEIDDICEKLHVLATDSQKSRSKKELREQRANFRQILRTVEGDSFGEEKVKILKELVLIQDWESKRYYDTFCAVLGSGLNIQLEKNVFLRSIFNLGPIVIDNGPVKRVSKFEKHYINNINSKNRKIFRGKQRDKRINSEDY